MAASEGVTLDRNVYVRIGQPLTIKTFRRMAAVAERDGRKCAYCGVVLPLEWYGLDHVVPHSRRGRDDLVNRVLACPPCDAAKADKTPQEWQPGVVFGNPFADHPYRVPGSQRRKAPAPALFKPLTPKTPPPRRRESMTPGGLSRIEEREGEWFEVAAAKPKGLTERQAQRRKGYGTTILFCATCATWVRVKGHASSHLLIADNVHE